MVQQLAGFKGGTGQGEGERWGGVQQGRTPNQVLYLFVEASPILLTTVNQTTELPWIQLGFSSRGA